VTGSLVAVREDLHLPTLEDVAEEYVRAGDGDASARCRRQGVTRFIGSFGTLAAWNAAPAAARMRLRTEVVSFAAFARCAPGKWSRSMWWLAGAVGEGPGPGHQVPRGGEPGHVGAGLGDDDVRGQGCDPRDGADQVVEPAKRLHQRLKTT